MAKNTLRKRRRRSTEIESEDVEDLDVTYILTEDGTLTLSVDGSIKIIPKAHHYYKTIRNACVSNDFETATSFAGISVNSLAWSKQVGLYRKGNSWQLNGQTVPAWLEKAVNKLVEDGATLLSIEIAIEKGDNNSSVKEGDDIMLQSPLSSVERVHIAKIGLAEFFRRHNQKVIDFLDDEETGITYTLAACRGKDLYALFVTKQGKQLVAAELPREYCESVHSALHYAGNQLPAVHKVINTAIKQTDNTSANGVKRPRRRITLD